MEEDLAIARKGPADGLYYVTWAHTLWHSGSILSISPPSAATYFQEPRGFSSVLSDSFPAQQRLVRLDNILWQFPPETAVFRAMGDQQPTQSSLASTFPNPPHFWQEFTPDRVSRFESLRKARAGQAGTVVDATTSLRIADLPEDLSVLQPPPEPAQGKWRCFGDLYTVRMETTSYYIYSSGIIVHVLTTNI